MAGQIHRERAVFQHKAASGTVDSAARATRAADLKACKLTASVAAFAAGVVRHRCAREEDRRISRVDAGAPPAVGSHHSTDLYAVRCASTMPPND